MVDIVGDFVKDGSYKFGLHGAVVESDTHLYFRRNKRLLFHIVANVEYELADGVGRRQALLVHRAVVFGQQGSGYSLIPHRRCRTETEAVEETEFLLSEDFLCYLVADNYPIRGVHVYVVVNQRQINTDVFPHHSARHIHEHAAF